MPNKHYEMDSILIAIITGFHSLRYDITDGEGVADSSLDLRIGDLRALFEEAVNLTHGIREEFK